MCVCKIKEIHPQICSGIETCTDKPTAEQQDGRTAKQMEYILHGDGMTRSTTPGQHFVHITNATL